MDPAPRSDAPESAESKPCISARIYYSFLYERWGRNGKTCFQSQGQLAAEFDVTIRTISRWEAAIADAGWWRTTYERRGRSTLRFLHFQHDPRTTDESSSARVVSPGHSCPPEGDSPGQPVQFTRTPGDAHPDTGGRSPGHLCPPTTRTVRDNNNKEASLAVLKKSSIEAATKRAVRLGCKRPGLSSVERGFSELWDSVAGDEEPAVLFSETLNRIFKSTDGMKNPPGALVNALKDKAWEKCVKEAKGALRGATISEEAIRARWAVQTLSSRRSTPGDIERAHKDLKRLNLTLEAAEQKVKEIFG